MSDAAAELDRVLDGIGRIAVAVSGGVDSMTLAVAAGRRLGPRASMLHVVSPAVPPEATARVRAYAGREGWDLAILDAGEFADPDYLRNPANRCYFCKTHLYGAMAARTAATRDRSFVPSASRTSASDIRPVVAKVESAGGGSPAGAGSRSNEA